MSSAATTPRWKPWLDFKDDPQGELLPIYGPPCSACKFWRPVVRRIETHLGSQFDGVRMCHSEEQERDFSCFKPKVES